MTLNPLKQATQTAIVVVLAVMNVMKAKFKLRAAPEATLNEEPETLRG